MDILFFAVLCALAGASGWIGFELRAIRKVHQARGKATSKLQGEINHILPGFGDRESATNDAQYIDRISRGILNQG